MSTRVCVSIGEETTARAVDKIRYASRWADLVEVRADYIQDLDLTQLFRSKPCPIIFTLRSPAEGGKFTGSETDRIRQIIHAEARGADYVDVEFSADWKQVLDAVPSESVILSYHNFAETPRSLASVFDAMARTPAAIIKIAVRAECLADNLRIASILRQGSAAGKRTIGLAMGGSGIVSRILGPSWGSWLTFASLPDGSPTADGQIPADSLIERYRIQAIARDSEIYGVVGKPLAHSLSPAIHNAVFASEKGKRVFVPLEASSLEDFVEFHGFCPIRGASVTIPYKEDAFALSESLSESARGTGSVNTLVRTETGWHGDNTDVAGFLKPLIEAFPLAGVRAAVLGAGGAARAAAYGLKSRGAAVWVVARTPSKGQRLAENLEVDWIPWERLPGLSWDLLVNATPIGMYPDVHACPLDPDLLTGGCVYDLVYNPERTRLLLEAARRGCTTVTGKEMFLGQAVKQQQVWFGQLPAEAVMRRALETALQQRSGETGEARRA